MEELTQRIEAIVERLIAVRQRGAEQSEGSDAPEGQDVLERFLAVKQVLIAHPPKRPHTLLRPRRPSPILDARAQP